MNNGEVVSSCEAGSHIRRLDRRDLCDSAHISGNAGDRVALFDHRDLAAWYVFQANAYAADRRDWYEPEAYRIAPVFRRIGQLLPELSVISGAEERAVRLLTEGRQQPDDGIYELLVAAAYQRNGWDQVEFVPEEPGRRKTHDLNVVSGRRRWAVECKRVGRSEYSANERSHGERLAAPIHALSRTGQLSAIVEVDFRVELSEVSTKYLAEHAERASYAAGATQWDDEVSRGRIRPVAWTDLRPVLASDDLYFGSSRMIQLAASSYVAEADHSVDGDWTPSRLRPFHARDVTRLSWLSSSHEAARRKAKHFRAMVTKAARQLPGDRPGVVHVGYELVGGNGADARRDLTNRLELVSFNVGESRLRYVYGNYMVPEHVTDANESAALTATTATYPIRGVRTPDPLPNHSLFSDGPILPGGYWLRSL